jgi:hypothetical protein
MKNIKEIILSMFETSRDRIKNPITGAFMFSWLIINWRIVLILVFSAKNVEEKINFIETNYVNLKINFWIPLGFAFFYSLILPYIMAFFDWLLQKAISYRRLISKENRITDIQHRQEIAAEEWQLEKIKSGSPDIDGLKSKINEITNQLLEKDDIILKLTNQIDENQEISDDSTEEDESDKENIEVEKTKNRPTKKKNRKPTTNSSNLNSSTTNSYSNNTDYPVMKDILIRDLPKTEREWLLIYSLYTSEFGKNVITRDDLIIKYSESNRKTESRLKNLSNNIKNMVKAGQLKFINDNEMLLTSSGQEIAREILNR